MTDRATWLAGRRAAVVAAYDAEAPRYDAEEYPNPLHGSFVDRLIASCPAGGLILDAPCGTGRYFPAIAAAGRRVVGIDQSAGMLAHARAKGIAERLERVTLQELGFSGVFDGAMTIDAMENVPPEDWPLVVGNVRRALRPSGHWYLTLEEHEEAVLDRALAALRASGQPGVRGEIVEGDVAGYHYSPTRSQALEWLAAGGFELVDEAFDQQTGWAYRHLLVRCSAADPDRSRPGPPDPD